MSRLTKEAAAWWLAAFIDGEGCVHLSRYKNGAVHYRIVTITNTEKCLIDFAEKCFQILGIGYRRSLRRKRTTGGKRAWVIESQRSAEVARISELIPIQSLKKRAKLKLCVQSARGIHCFGCGCLHDDFTKGCNNCIKRHRMRAYHKPKKKRRVYLNGSQMVRRSTRNNSFV